MFQIEHCTLADLDEIMHSYAAATLYQKERYEVTWPVFDPAMIKATIEEKHQWKMLQDGQTVCFWTTTFDDPFIWGEKNNDPAVYIHRISTSNHFRGNNLVQQIVEWAKNFALENNKVYIRMDTVGENKKLIAHYTKSGFTFLGMLPLNNTNSLPAHYHNASVALFELKVQLI